MSPEPQTSVLVVEDDAITRLIVSETLATSGCAVEARADGEAALAAALARTPDLVILDLELPGIDGYEVCRRLRACPGTARVPVLVMTASDDLHAVERAFEAGATDFLTKPLHLLLLGQRVRYLVRAARALQHLDESRHRLARAQRLARLAPWQVAGPAFSWSEGALDAFFDGAVPGALLEGGLLPLVHPEDRARVAAAMAEGPHRIAYRLLLPGARVHHVRQEAELVDDGRGGQLLLGALQDETEARGAERQILRLAYWDELTGLPGAAFLARQLERFVAGARASGERVGAVVVDLDVSRPVNDTLGHAGGDALLAVAAATIAGVARAWGELPGAEELAPERFAGQVLVARASGDELAVLVRGPEAHVEARALAERLAQALRPALRAEALTPFVRASLGVADFPGSADEASALLPRARAAMHEARAAGEPVRSFSSETHARMRARAELERRLRVAVGQLGHEPGASGFALHYQPKIAARSGGLAGVEALLRWHPAGQAPISPAHFVPLAEDAGLIVALGSWVLREACQQAARWARAGLCVPVAINVSPRQLCEPGFAAEVARVLRELELPPGRIEIEITEHAMVQNGAAAAEALSELSRLGVGIALDDFGTGYSSLSYLTRLPIHILKIDRSFVRGLGGSSSCESVADAILAMARSLGLRVVAEGIEEQRQADYLLARGAPDLQGFLFARPMPADELLAAMRAQGRLAAPRPLTVEASP